VFSVVRFLRPERCAKRSAPVVDGAQSHQDTARREALAAAAASAEQVLVTAAVVDDIPRDWLADRVDITLTDGDSGPASAVVTEVHDEEVES